MKIEGVNVLGHIQCSCCSHWCLDENENMFCQWYGESCEKIKDCPVRSLDMMQGQKRLAWTILDIIAKNRRYVIYQNKVLKPKDSNYVEK